MRQQPCAPSGAHLRRTTIPRRLGRNTYPGPGMASRVNQLYDWLKHLPSPAAEQILSAAMEHAEPEYAALLSAQLLARKTETAWAGLLVHYPQLPPATRNKLAADAGLLRNGLSLAMHAPSPKARGNALVALGAHMCPELAFLLPDALRDSTEDVRREAARTLRQMAELVLDARPAPAADPAERRAYEARRAEVARAAREAARTYDLHYRLEAIEVALWFAAELGDVLWEWLANPRSSASFIIRANLAAWNSPRLARFLLQGIAQASWRHSVVPILQSWHTPEEIAEVLRHTDILADNEIARRLVAVRDPCWFDGLGPHLEALPAELRPWAVRWLLLLGYSATDKLDFLRTWCRSSCEPLRQAAARGLEAVVLPDQRAAPRAAFPTIREEPTVPREAPPPARHAPRALPAPPSRPAIAPPRRAVEVSQEKQKLRRMLEELLAQDDALPIVQQQLQQVQALMRQVDEAARSPAEPSERGE